MKSTLIVALATLLLGATAATASAADIQSCTNSTKKSTAPGYERVGHELRLAVVPEAKRYLGDDQWVGDWMQPADGGWYLGVAPGTHSLAQVRAWLRGRIAKHFQAREAALVRTRVHVIRQPYAMHELHETGSAIWKKLARDGKVNFEGWDGCYQGTFRTRFVLFKEAPDSWMKIVRKYAKPYGDRVRVVRVNRHQDDSVS